MRWFPVSVSCGEWRPNKHFQLTPLRGPKIGGILQSDFGSTAFPIYSAAQLKRKALDGNPLNACSVQDIL
jgi:hypothetical protein